MPQFAPTPKQRKAIALLASGLSITATAEQVGVDRSTIRRWLRDPDFSAELDAAVSEDYNQLVSLVLNNSSEAFEILLDLAKDEQIPGYARVSAATNVLDFASKSFQGHILERRLSRLEADNEVEQDGD